MTKRVLFFVASVLGLGAVHCGDLRVNSHTQVSQAEWAHARGLLFAIRADEPRRPYTERVAVAVRMPITGRMFEGRGAVAVDPKRAMRMILIGPGGSTALDVWISRERWRVTVPELEFEERGEAREEPGSGLPIGFFRWWFLNRFDGRLLWASVAEPDTTTTMVLRDGDATVTLQHQPLDGLQHLMAARRHGETTEHVSWSGSTPRPAAGTKATYVQDATGLKVEVTVESIEDESPDPRAFVDPDDTEDEAP